MCGNPGGLATPPGVYWLKKKTKFDTTELGLENGLYLCPLPWPGLQPGPGGGVLQKGDE